MLRTRIRRPTGVIIAPPMPWTIRASTNSSSERESAQPIEPSTNTPMAMRKTLRAPKRSAIQPLAGMKMASASRYEVTASFSASGLVPSARAIAGSDVAITVESMFSMNKRHRDDQRDDAVVGTGRRAQWHARLSGIGFEPLQAFGGLLERWIDLQRFAEVGDRRLLYRRAARGSVRASRMRSPTAH